LLGTHAATLSHAVRLATRDSSAFRASCSYHAPALPFLPASASCSTLWWRGPRLPAPGGHRRPRRQTGSSLAPRSCLLPPTPPRGGAAPACRCPAAAITLAGRQGLASRLAPRLPLGFGPSIGQILGPPLVDTNILHQS
jgi:hypothetical protein